VPRCFITGATCQSACTNPTMGSILHLRNSPIAHHYHLPCAHGAHAHVFQRMNDIRISVRVLVAMVTYRLRSTFVIEISKFAACASFFRSCSILFLFFPCLSVSLLLLFCANCILPSPFLGEGFLSFVSSLVLGMFML
jgi:hypothetical protein